MIYIGHFWSKTDKEKISIALSQPRGMNLREERKLNPTWDILNRYKKDGNWKQYVIEYNKILSKLDPTIVAEKWDNKVLCCFCGSNKCHRYLVATWLINAGIDVEVI
jgi:hypothetical protein